MVKLFMPYEIYGDYINTYIIEVLKDYNIHLNYCKKCLCESNPKELSKREIYFIHPHRKKDCYEKISRIINENPNNEFYVFAMGNSSGKERKDIIGKYNNLEYIDSDNYEKIFEKIRN